jgi:glutamate-1-semialdehyde 2,1-aminomutase
LNLLESILKSDPQIAAVILEPTGGHWGAVPIRGPFLKELRSLTFKYGNVLIFDEVITGFRVSSGGAQQHYGVLPDLTSLAKILAGGLPGGCLVGKAEILSGIEFRPGKPKMKHPGTYNANPLSAAAGIATLKRVATTDACSTANAMARRLRNGLNQLFADRNLPWVAYTDFSMFRLLPNYRGPRPEAATRDDNGIIPYEGDLNLLDGPKNSNLVFAFKQAMLLNGIDLPTFGGWLSAAHTENDIDTTIQAVGKSLEMIGEL